MPEIIELNEKLPSVISDPFKKNKVTKILVVCNESFLTEGKWSAWGSVTFKNGKTEGEQKFDGATFDDVVIQIKAMLETLE